MRRVFKFLIMVAVMLISVQSYANKFEKAELKDQFDNLVLVDENVRWVVLSADKAISEIIHQTIEDLKLTDLAKSHGLYVSDISKMPSLITKMFALPKMKKFNYKITLDREGEVTAKWPRQKEQASLIKLKQFEIVSVSYASKAEEIKKFISENSAGE